MNNHALGTSYALFSYIFWGFMPIFWKLLDVTPAQNIFANRIVWTLVLCFLIILGSNRWQTVNHTLKDKKKRLGFLGCGLLLGINWFTYLYAVTSNQVLEASMGYYINPLFSIFLALAFLKERMNLWQTIAACLALAGVLIITVHYGQIPWIAITLAVTFGFYSLIKKQIHLDVSVGLSLEMAVLLPLVIIYIWIKKETAVLGVSLSSDRILLMLTGVVTAIPLLSFAVAAKKIPLARIGFLQYITPTMFFFLATLFFHEPFSQTQLISFIFIWMALILYTFSNTAGLIHVEDRLLKKGH